MWHVYVYVVNISLCNFVLNQNFNRNTDPKRNWFDLPYFSMNAKFIVPSCYTMHAHVITFNNYETEIIYTDDVVFEFLTIFVDLERILDVFELI